MKIFLITYEPGRAVMKGLSPVSKVEVKVLGKNEIEAQDNASSILGSPFHMYLQATNIQEIQ